MKLNEQQLINALCEYMAERRQVGPESVHVELEWDETYGFSAEVTVEGRSQILVESNLIDAAMRYVFHHHDLRVHREQVSLALDEEMYVQFDLSNQ